MITLFHLLNSEDLSKEDIIVLKQYFQNYIESSESPEWLKTVDLSKINFKWCKEFSQEQLDELGAWTPFTFNTVYLKPLNKKLLTGNKFADESVYELHQLYHRQQCCWYTYPVYLLLSINVWREFTIESSAYQLEDTVRDWISKYEQQKFKSKYDFIHTEFYRNKF